ncbi:GTP pyrophosphokinase family protein [Paenibacillus alvei]|uniref:GTP pyrophosphokinase family protein n=1 Tax=Paenibacillus alvei TaxID=44250 RepID=A0ABT4H4V0_PAEAL|nr:MULTISPECIES: GTP pyrophosphokinase family protein [Paenibacillus]EJW17698.1 GTP pyrophosphokinase YjbM [Paenibacillus alvei DSM 29]MCY7486759.1 GTP pyrophosphokinase family protein [Paenibacillus alvei]MCY9540667.1 GTP pyrophosphokinase family protein [Paenibacillus alvei]MCY9707068.1 GTP pyrophosphokinase family protein [Paenibacillus alvei]MCY9735172.1 GTP pyrophosphokinase family protein [Paenibacillus alvei]
MDGRDWGNFLLPYAQAVEELKVKFKTLRTELKKREEYSPIEFVTGRVKRISSILEKSKRLEVPLDQLERGIEDIAGIRIMCQFVDDIHRVADLIRNRQDMKVVYEKDYITNYKESGYRSFHMIIEYPVQTALGQKMILGEIQIRTLAMNFWATIEHSLNYKYKDSLPEEVRQRLKTAAEAAFVLDNEMSSIRQEILVAQQSFEDKSKIVQKCLSFIQELYYYHRISEAIQFQNRFNEVWEKDDITELKNLEEEITRELESAKKNGDIQL